MRKLLGFLFLIGSGMLLLAWLNSREPTRSAPERAAPTPRPPASGEPDRCAATTQSGKRCSRPAESGSRFCWQHGE